MYTSCESLREHAMKIINLKKKNDDFMIPNDRYIQNVSDFRFPLMITKINIAYSVRYVASFRLKNLRCQLSSSFSLILLFPFFLSPCC